MAKKQEIQDMAARLCSVLTDLGCDFHFEADNRSSHRSHYIYVRRPKYIEIRVSDHRATKRPKQFDVGPHGMPVDHAIQAITTLLKS
jgi:hypothetical protein